MCIDNKLIIAWLNSENKVGNKTIERLIEYFGDVKDIWYNLKNEKNNLTFLNKESIDNLILKQKSFEDTLQTRLYKEHVTITTIFDENYPEKLKYIINPPLILYCKGDLSCLDKIGIGIVGSRKATDYGKWCADKFSRELSSYGINIISGLAVGIDTIAHKSAIKNNGTTIGVIGCGINIVYPSKNVELYKQIEDSKGAIITEYPFDMEPMANNFPARNRIISGLSSGILVIEAQNKSGTLITCSHAAEQGRDVFAVPGNINSIFSIGTNKLIKDGAKPVICVEDILEEIPELNYDSMSRAVKKIEFDSLKKIEQDIVKIIMESEKSVDEITCSLNYSTNEILSTLTILEMKGIINQISSKKFILAN